MYLYTEKLINDIAGDEPDPAAANALQEGLGGQFGEMRTMMQYLFQSINFRGDASSKPYKDLLQGVGTEEISTLSSSAPRSPGCWTAHLPIRARGPIPSTSGGQRGPRRSRSPWIPATSITIWSARRAPCQSMRRETRGAARTSITAAISCSTCSTT